MEGGHKVVRISDQDEFFDGMDFAKDSFFSDAERNFHDAVHRTLGRLKEQDERMRQFFQRDEEEFRMRENRDEGRREQIYQDYQADMNQATIDQATMNQAAMNQTAMDQTAMNQTAIKQATMTQDDMQRDEIDQSDKVLEVTKPDEMTRDSGERSKDETSGLAAESSRGVIITTGDTCHKIILDMSDFSNGQVEMRVSGDREIMVEAATSKPFHTFRRPFSLPLDIDMSSITSVMGLDGILTITAPKQGKLGYTKSRRLPMHRELDDLDDDPEHLPRHRLSKGPKTHHRRIPDRPLGDDYLYPDSDNLDRPSYKFTDDSSKPLSHPFADDDDRFKSSAYPFLDGYNYDPSKPLHGGKDDTYKPLHGGKDDTYKPLHGGKDDTYKPLHGSKDDTSKPLKGGKEEPYKPFALHQDDKYKSSFYPHLKGYDEPKTPLVDKPLNGAKAEPWKPLYEYKEVDHHSSKDSTHKTKSDECGCYKCFLNDVYKTKM